MEELKIVRGDVEAISGVRQQAGFAIDGLISTTGLGRGPRINRVFDLSSYILLQVWLARLEECRRHVFGGHGADGASHFVNSRHGNNETGHVVRGPLRARSHSMHTQIKYCEALI